MLGFEEASAFVVRTRSSSFRSDKTKGGKSSARSGSANAGPGSRASSPLPGKSTSSSSLSTPSTAPATTSSSSTTQAESKTQAPPPPRMSLAKLSKHTGLTQDDLRQRQQDFDKQFPNGQVTQDQFRKMAVHIIEDEQEVTNFVKNVFKMFDKNRDSKLNFEEFTLATTAKEGMGKKAEQKLEWLFDNVYDKDNSGDISKRELEEILSTMLKMEGVPDGTIRELVKDIFKEMDANGDGCITKAEFINAAKSCSHLRKILNTAAEKEIKKRTKKKSGSMRRKVEGSVRLMAGTSKNPGFT